MPVKEFKIKLDKDVFYSGTKVTGNLLVRTSNQNWIKNGRIFVKFYDKLDIEWVEDERMSIGVAKVVYTNFKRQYQISNELFINADSHSNANTTPSTPSRRSSQSGNLEMEYLYPFEFEIPKFLQATINVKNGRCQYFIKAYLTSDDAIAKHYQTGVNVFDEFFKSLNHTFCKQEVTILNPLAKLPSIGEKHSYEAKSSNIKVIVTLPRLFYKRNETIQVHCHIERIDNNSSNSSNNDQAKQLPVEIHKVAFKLLQVVKLVAVEPFEKSRLFDTLIAHSSRKNIHQNSIKGVVLEEFLQIPAQIPSSSSRTTTSNDSTKPKLNPIRINYKLCLEFWKNFLVNELDVNVPLMIDPEA